MQIRLLALLSVPAAALLAAPLAAHHSVRATYDSETLVPLAGTVSDIQWRNPHSTFVLATSDAAGNPIAWTIEMGAPNAMIRQGIPRDFLKAGDAVSLEVWTAKDGTMNAHARAIVFADGRRIDLPEDRWMGLETTAN